MYYQSFGCGFPYRSYYFKEIMTVRLEALNSLSDTEDLKWIEKAVVKFRHGFSGDRDMRWFFVLLNMDHKTLVFQFSFISHDIFKKTIYRNIKNKK